MKFLLQVTFLLLAALALPSNVIAQGNSADVNGDGEVTIADINTLIDAILNGAQGNAADVNGDGEVTIADINTVIEVILNGSITPPGPQGDFGNVPQELLDELVTLGMNINYGDEPPIVDGTFLLETIDSIALIGPYNTWIPYGDEEYMVEFEMFPKMIMSFQNQHNNQISVLSVPFYDPDDPDYYDPDDIVYLDMSIMGRGNKFTIGLYFTIDFIFPGEGIGLVISGEVAGQNLKNVQFASIDIIPNFADNQEFIAILYDRDGISYPTDWEPEIDWDDWDLAPKTNRSNTSIKTPMLKRMIKSHLIK